jgi:site-specific DNA-cytosine methylase
MPKKAVLSLFSGCGGFDLGFEGGFSVPAVRLDATTRAPWSV